MRSFLSFCLLLLVLSPLSAQKLTIRHDAPIPAKSWMLGFETGGAGGSGQNPDTGERFAFHNYRVRPRLTLFPYQNLGIGIQAEYEWAWTHLAPLENYYGYGAFVRYYWGSRAFGNEKLMIRLNYFAELNYNRSTNPGGDLLDFNTIPAPLANATYEDLSLTLGLHLRPWRGLILEAGWGLHYLPSHPDQRNWQIGGRVGIDWLFSL